MQYRIQFLDAAAAAISELIADAHNTAGAISLVADIDWPPHAVTMRVFDADGREVPRSRANGYDRAFASLRITSLYALAGVAGPRLPVRAFGSVYSDFVSQCRSQRFHCRDL